VVDVSRDRVAEAAPDKAEGKKDADPKAEDGKPNEPGYVAHVALDSTRMMVDGHEERLSPGMAEIKTGRRSVMSYLLSPLRRYAHEGGGRDEAVRTETTDALGKCLLVKTIKEQSSIYNGIFPQMCRTVAYGFGSWLHVPDMVWHDNWPSNHVAFPDASICSSRWVDSIVPFAKAQVLGLLWHRKRAYDNGLHCLARARDTAA